MSIESLQFRSWILLERLPFARQKPNDGLLCFYSKDRTNEPESQTLGTSIEHPNIYGSSRLRIFGGQNFKEVFSPKVDEPCCWKQNTNQTNTPEAKSVQNPVHRQFWRPTPYGKATSSAFSAPRNSIGFEAVNTAVRTQLVEHLTAMFAAVLTEGD